MEGFSGYTGEFPSVVLVLGWRVWNGANGRQAPVRFVLTRVFGRWNAWWWRFAPLDNDGNRQELYALGE